MAIMKRNVFLYLCFIFFVISMFGGCGNNDLVDFTNNGEEYYAQFYADSAYLEFEGDPGDLLVIWPNMSIYAPAYERMRKHLKLKDNILTWDIKNAATIRISDNIFNYITNAWKQDNAQLESGKYRLEFDGAYYSIIPKQPKMKSRISPHLKLRNHDEYSWRTVVELYDEIEMGDNICVWVDCDENFRPDNTGGKYLYGILQNSKVWGYAEMTYWITNCCVTSPDYNCECNIIRTGNSESHYDYNTQLTTNIFYHQNHQHARLLKYSYSLRE